MPLSNNAKLKIEDLLKDVIRQKLDKYNPETSYMPFHFRLLGRDRYAMFSFIQSMNTTFGISIWEQVSVIIARDAGFEAERQYKLKGEVDRDTEKLIQKIVFDLRKGKLSPNKEREINLIRNKIKRGEEREDPDSTVDLFVIIGSQENYFDITSAKPNMKEFQILKTKLLRWTALRLSQNRRAKAFTRLAIPYNPYHPEPYERWTLKGLYDLDNNEILIGEDYWNFIANDKIYDDLLDVFEEVGNELRNEIDERMTEFR
ncbi:MAG: TdeIII family type II restriction endonuclease [Ignavibacteria bacterium]